MTKRVVTRSPDDDVAGQWPIARLREEGLSLPLLHVLGEVRAGEEMHLMLQLREDGHPTHRMTTPVEAVHSSADFEGVGAVGDVEVEHRRDERCSWCASYGLTARAMVVDGRVRLDVYGRPACLTHA